MAKTETVDTEAGMAPMPVDGFALAISRGGDPMCQVVKGKALFRVMTPDGDLLSWTRRQVMAECVAVYPLTYDHEPLDDAEAGKAMVAAAMR